MLIFKIILLFQSKVSIWSKTADTKIENSGAYILEHRSIVSLFHPKLFISHKESLDTEVSIVEL